jgi:hypothetical protein
LAVDVTDAKMAARRDTARLMALPGDLTGEDSWTVLDDMRRAFSTRALMKASRRVEAEEVSSVLDRDMRESRRALRVEGISNVIVEERSSIDDM